MGYLVYIGIDLFITSQSLVFENVYFDIVSLKTNLQTREMTMYKS